MTAEITDVSRPAAFAEASVYPIITTTVGTSLPANCPVRVRLPDDRGTGFELLEHDRSVLELLPSNNWGVLLSTGGAVLRRLQSGRCHLATWRRYAPPRQPLKQMLYLGVKLLSDPVVTDIAGKRTLITHGDVVGDGATRSRIERRLARTRPFVALLRFLHPDWVARIQPFTTSTRRQVRMHDAGQGGGPKHRAPPIEAWARETLRKDPSLNLVIAGHAHLPAAVEVEPGRYYLNAGDWITHFTYVAVSAEGRPEVREWAG